MPLKTGSPGSGTLHRSFPSKRLKAVSFQPLKSGWIGVWPMLFRSPNTAMAASLHNTTALTSVSFNRHVACCISSVVL